MCMQYEDPGELAQDFGTIASTVGNHKRKIKRLEQLKNVDVSVTVSTHQQRLLLPPGRRVRLSELGVEGEVLWSPRSATEEVKVEESTEGVVVQR